MVLTLAHLQAAWHLALWTVFLLVGTGEAEGNATSSARTFPRICHLGAINSVHQAHHLHHDQRHRFWGHVRHSIYLFSFTRIHQPSTCHKCSIFELALHDIHRVYLNLQNWLTPSRKPRVQHLKLRGELRTVMLIHLIPYHWISFVSKILILPYWPSSPRLLRGWLSAHVSVHLSRQCSCRYELIMQYFQIKLNFDTRDQSHMFVLSGICGMFTQLVILRVLLKYAGKSGMLLIGKTPDIALDTFQLESARVLFIGHNSALFFLLSKHRSCNWLPELPSYHNFSGHVCHGSILSWLIAKAHMGHLSHVLCCEELSTGSVLGLQVETWTYICWQPAIMLDLLTCRATCHFGSLFWDPLCALLVLSNKLLQDPSCDLYKGQYDSKLSVASYWSLLLFTGLAASTIQQALMIFVWNKPIALFAMCIGSIGNLSFPAVSSIKSVNIAESEQVIKTHYTKSTEVDMNSYSSSALLTDILQFEELLLTQYCHPPNTACKVYQLPARFCIMMIYISAGHSSHKQLR